MKMISTISDHSTVVFNEVTLLVYGFEYLLQLYFYLKYYIKDGDSHFLHHWFSVIKRFLRKLLTARRTDYLDKEGLWSCSNLIFQL